MKQLFIFSIITVCSNFLGAQNIGIDVSAPAYKLDVNGRMRLQTVNAVPARLAFTGSTDFYGASVGTIDDNNMGFFGSQAGLMLTMNVNNGRVGIATNAPSTALDINGTLRIRGSAPIPGAVLTSMDANGNTKWIGVSFKVAGTLGEVPFNLTTDYPFFQRFKFGQTEYNMGNGWDQINAVFLAPYKGVYHFAFNAQTIDANVGQYLQVVRWRNNKNEIIYRRNIFQYYDGERLFGNDHIGICFDISMEAGEPVWIESSNSLDGTTKCDGKKANYYFTGNLITLL